MEIVIVGAGKAGWLHSRAFAKLARLGREAPRRIQFLDRTGRPGTELGLEPGATLVAASRDELAATGPAETIIDFCLPARSLAPALVDWWQAGYRKFIVEKPFLIPPDLRDDVGEVLASAQVVRIQNYLYSRAHCAVRELVRLYGLEPTLCVTNFSKDRRADNQRGRGASDAGTPTIFEIEIPHQLYIGADIIGQVRSLDYAQDRGPASADAAQARLGECVLVGTSAPGAHFVHYSNLQNPSTVRTLDVFCRGNFSLHAVYAPVCEELTDIKASVILSRGDHVLAKKLFTEDDNMLGMIADAFTTLSGPAGGRVALDDVLRDDAVIRAANGNVTWSSAEVVESRADVIEHWIIDSFRSGLETGVGRSLLGYLEYRQRHLLADLLPALAPREATAAHLR